MEILLYQHICVVSQRPINMFIVVSATQDIGYMTDLNKKAIRVWKLSPVFSFHLCLFKKFNWSLMIHWWPKYSFWLSTIMLTLLFACFAWRNLPFIVSYVLISFIYLFVIFMGFRNLFMPLVIFTVASWASDSINVG